MNEMVNTETGEVYDLENMDDEELAVALKEIDEQYNHFREARHRVKEKIIERMAIDGARLRHTEVAKFTVNRVSKVNSQEMVKQLFRECPMEYREKCFKSELTPKKIGLRELAKLSREWRLKVDSLYREEKVLKIEWSDK